MAKRFTDSEKWKNPFLRSLKAPYKLLWLYIWDECDHAGLWVVDLEVAQIKIGEKVKLSEALSAFSNKIIPVENGNCWFIPEFVEFQYGELSDKNRVHTKVIQLLKKYNLLEEDLKINKAPSKDLLSPLLGVKEEDKEEEQLKEKKEAGKIILLNPPWDTDNFKQCWNRWIRYKKDQHKFVYKSNDSHQAAMDDLFKLSNGSESLAVEIINQSIAKSWSGLFELKTNSKSQEVSKGFDPKDYGINL